MIPVGGIGEVVCVASGVAFGGVETSGLITTEGTEMHGLGGR